MKPPSLKPLQRLYKLMSKERQSLYILLVYTGVSGLLTLTIPITTQILVQIIAAGVFIQPLIMLSIVLFVALVIGGAIRVFEFFLVEVIQQRIFVGIALKLADKIPLIQHKALLNRYAPELLNRFFDVVIVQKTFAKLLLDTPSAVLQIVVGLLVMAFYSPILLAFDVVFVVVFAWVCLFLGKNGIASSVDESIQKYRIASWLEELARCQISLKLDAHHPFLLERADQIVIKYINARKSHFTVVLRQTIASYLFQALVATSVLAIGGWLVIHKQLTLGQLVASEVIIVLVLSAMEKLVNSFPSYFDLLAALDKVGYLTDLPTDPQAEAAELVDERLNTPEGIKIDCKNLSFTYQDGVKVLEELTMEIAPGGRVSLVGASGVGKTTLGLIICGVMKPDKGIVNLNGIDIQQLSSKQIHALTSFVSDQNDVIEGTVLENIVLGRPNVTLEDVQWALQQAELADEIALLPQGFSTPVISTGLNLSRGQIQRLMIARAIVDKPKLLILDECFTGVDDATRCRVLDNLLNKANQWTLLDISHDPELVLRTEHVYVLSKGKIVLKGSPLELLTQNEEALIKLFPSMVKELVAAK